MNFDDLEGSADLGEPINLYKFSYGPEPEDCYNYTDAEQPLVFEGEVYYPRIIRRGDIHASGSTDKSTLEISLPNTDPVAEFFRVYPPSYPVVVFIWQGHGLGGEFMLQWSGKVLSCSREGALEANLTCEPASVSMQRIGLRRHYQYMCPHALYSQGYGQCNADKEAATIAVYAESVSGRNVLLGALLSNPSHYGGGIVEWVNLSGLTEYRTVLSVAEVEGKTQLTLSGIAREFPVGVAASLSKGCAHNMSACINIHNNIFNFGGQPYIPTKNPLGRNTPFL